MSTSKNEFAFTSDTFQKTVVTLSNPAANWLIQFSFTASRLLNKVSAEFSLIGCQLTNYNSVLKKSSIRKILTD